MSTNTQKIREKLIGQTVTDVIPRKGGGFFLKIGEQVVSIKRLLATKRAKVNANLERLSVSYDVAVVLPKLASDEKVRIHLEEFGTAIKTGSLRYNLFHEKGLKCALCELEIGFLAAERDRGVEHYHVNAYGVDEDGDEVLFTKDHIIPKSRGGDDSMDNLQVLCLPCNYIKNDDSF